MQEKMADYVAAILAGKKEKAGFISFILGVTKECDCLRGEKTPELEDVGILASLDPVAIDKAAFDLVNQQAGKNLFQEFYLPIDPCIQIRAAEELGIGTMDYRLITDEL
jgi:uncharacterized Fe-S center protein